MCVELVNTDVVWPKVESPEYIARDSEVMRMRGRIYSIEEMRCWNQDRVKSDGEQVTKKKVEAC